MEIAIISDVHGNEVALDSVLNDMPKVDRIYCLGDIIGYSPKPEECVEKIRRVSDIVLQGNHERELRVCEGFDSRQYTREQLSEEQIKWLQSNPESTTTRCMKLAHSHPVETDKYVRPMDFADMGEYLHDHSLLALGHTHVQHVVDIEKFGKNKYILNPGSLGQPKDNDWRAAYATVSVEDCEVSNVTLHRVEYDVDLVVEQVKNAGLPIENGTRLLED